MSTIKLQSDDDQIFEVEIKAAQLSYTMKAMLDHLGAPEAGEVMPLAVRGPILDMALKWAMRYKDEPPVLDDDDDVGGPPEWKKVNDISQWDREFLKVIFCLLYYDSFQKEIRVINCIAYYPFVCNVF